MKAAFLKAPFQVEIRDLPTPEPGDGQVRLNVKACGVCGSDINTAKSAGSYERFGHELAGVVEALGPNVKHIKVGDRVTLESSHYCNDCPACRNGHPELCTNRSFPGYDGFAEQILASEEMLVPIRSLSFEEASLIEPMGVAMDLVEVADIKLGNHVVVFGAGPIGIMAVRLAKLKGASKVTVCARSHSGARIAAAKAFGADEIVYTDLVESLPAYFKDQLADRVLVTTPPPTLKDALSIGVFGCIVSVIGIGSSPEDSMVTLDINALHFNRMQLRFSHATPALFFPLCIDLVEKGLIDVKSLISHRFPLEEMDTGMKLLKTDKENTVKVVMVRE